MEGSQHPDEVERLRAALWGDAAVAPDTLRHVENCDACRVDVEFHQRVRDVFRVWSSAVPSEAALARTRAAAADPGEPMGEVEWTSAVPVGGLSGVRSTATADLHVVCETRGLSLDVVLHAAGGGGRYTVSGQVLRADFTPGGGMQMTLVVDRRRAEETTTDAFGEFAFGVHAGERWGLRVGSGESAVHVEIRPAAGAR